MDPVVYDDNGKPISGTPQPSLSLGTAYDDQGKPIGKSTLGPPPEPPAHLKLSGPTTLAPARTSERSILDMLGQGDVLDYLKSLGGSGSGAETTVDAIRGATTPAAIADAAPAAGATALALATGGASIPVTMGAAALGGMGGLGVKRAIQAGTDVPVARQDMVGRALFPRGIPDSLKGDLTELFGEGAKQGAMQGVGEFMGKALRMGAAPDKVVALAEELGLPLKPQTFMEKVARRTITGRQVASNAAIKGQGAAMEDAATQAATLGQAPPVPEQSALKYIQDTQAGFKADLAKAGKEAATRGLSEADAETQALLAKISPESVPTIQVGQTAQSAARRGVSLGRKETEKLYSAADALNQSAAVDITDHVAALKAMSEEAALAPSQDPAALVLYAKKLSETVPQLGLQSSLAKALGMPASEIPAALSAALQKSMDAQPALVIPYAEARELQKWLGQRLSGKLSDNIAKGRLKQAWSTMADAVESSVAGTEGGVALKEANAAYRDFSDVAKRGAVPVLVERFRSSPEDVIALMSRGPSRVQQLRKAIVTYAERNGTLQDQAAAHDAWDQMGRTFAEEKILDGGITKLPQRLLSVGDETLDALYGREMANNWRTLGSSVSALKSNTGPLAPSAAQAGALTRLQDLDAALRISTQPSSQGGMGFYTLGAGVSWPVSLAAKAAGIGGAAAVVPMAAVTAAAAGGVEVAGGLLTWAATNRVRTRAFANAAAEGFRSTAPATLRLVNSYLDYQRDMALVQSRKGQGPVQGPPPPDLSTASPAPPSAAAPPPEPLSFSFLPPPRPPLTTPPPAPPY